MQLLRKVVGERFRSVDASWRSRFRSGVYVPAIAQQQLGKLKSAPANEVLRELERLVALANPWAAALLAYQALLLKADGTREVDKAIALCKESAARGDAYSQYIMYWASLLKGNQGEATGYLKASVRQFFPPAVLDSIGFFWMLRHNTNPKGVLKPLSQARAVGHYGAFLWRCTLYITGKLGLGRTVVGYICFPIAALTCAYNSWRHPFSARTFVFDVKIAAVPLLRRG